MKSLEAIETFEERARAFCSTLEGTFGTGTEALRRLRDVLLPLYTAALALPSMSVTSAGDLPEDTERITQQRRAIEQRLTEAGFQNESWVVFDPLRLDREDPLITTLSDGLADIWRDLKPGLEALDTNREKYHDDTLWDWRFSFWTHWGRHAIDALRAIHFQLEDIG